MDHRPILVTGGTGAVGRPLVDRLLERDAVVRVMSRHPRRTGDDRRYDWASADLGTGRGLAAALAGVGTIVHCATNRRNDTAGTRRLVEAARAMAEQPLLVYISIVGVDRIAFGYYRHKLECERLIEDSGLPWTILRTTQFHDLIAAMTLATGRSPVALAPRGVRVQPIEVTEVAERLAELACSPAAGRVADMGGPEIREARDLARAALRAAGRRRPTVPLWLPGKTYRSLHDGLLAPDQAVGKATFEDYLADRFAI